MEILDRSILPKLLAEARKPFCSVLIGPRQVGKTVLLRQLAERLQGKTTYLDAENPQDALVFRDGLRSLLAEIGTGPQTLLIDEFHRLPDPLTLFKQIRDAHPKIKVYASGSSSLEINRHLGQSAVGRVRRTRVFPLSVSEWYRQFSDVDLANWELARPLPPREADRLSQRTEQFITWGGMPELLRAQDEDEKREILREIVGLYLEKDIRSLLRSDAVFRFNEFLRLVALGVGQIANKAEFGRSIGVSARQVENQLQVMEHTFVLRPASTDYANPTKRLVKSPKLYFYDNGVRNSLVRDFRPRHERPDGGSMVENHVYNELEKSAGPDVAVLYHRSADGQEIDFVLEKDRRKILVEVKSSLSRPVIPAALKDVSTRDDVVACVIVNERLHLVQEHAGKPVYFIPHGLAHGIPALLDR